MKRLSLIGILVLSAALVWLPAVAQANILTNPDFESGTLGQFDNDTNTKIDGWTTFGTSGWYHTDYNHTAGGSRAIKIWWDDTAAYQDFSATAGTSYDFSGYAYSPSGDYLTSGWNGLLKVEWFSGDTKLGENEIGRFIGGTDPADTWKYLSSSYSAPSGVDTARVVMTIINTDPTWTQPHSGSVGWDDISAASPIPEPTSLILLGSGLVGLFGISRRKK
jgi:hypothetical protein